MTLVFALVSSTPLVRPRDLHRMCDALETCALHCAQAWRREPPAVVVCDDVSKLPAYASPVVFVDNGTDMDALAVHYYTPQRGPAARVYVDRGTLLNGGTDSLVERASHEINEALVSPQVNLWADHPDAERAESGVQVAVEVSDPLQDTYVVRDAGTDWQVSNFVTPHWFDARLRDYVPTADMRFDHAGRLRHPGHVGPEGYVVLRAPASVAPGGYGAGAWRTWLEDAHGQALALLDVRAGKGHAWARTKVRLGV